MGICASKPKPKQKQEIKKGKIQIHCPICEENYDTEDHKPYVVCLNKHTLCHSCLSSMKNHAVLIRKGTTACPFCKLQIEEDMVSTDAGIYSFLNAELQTLKKLPDNQKQLFAFSSIYLPNLHKFMKVEAGSGSRNKGIDSLELIRIKGKMLKEYQVFEMEMLNCMIALKKIYLNNNQIIAIDINLYTRPHLQLLDLSNNRITNIKNILNEAKGVFASLKVLNMKHNLIEDLDGLNKFQHLQILNLNNNKLKSISFAHGCKALRHINVEFNKIDSLQLQSSFSNFWSLQLFGNSIPVKATEDIVNFPWRELRFFTLSLNDQSIIQKSSIHARISSMESSPLLRLSIFEVSSEEPQDTSQVIENVNSKSSILDKRRKVQLNIDSYTFYTEHKSFLKDIVQKVAFYHPLGKNINFISTSINKKNFSFQEKSNTYKRINPSNEPAQYLCSEILQGKVFMSLTTKAQSMIVGVREASESDRRVELSFKKESIRTNLEQHSCKPFKQKLAGKEPVEVSMSLNSEQWYIEFVVAGTTVEKYYFCEKWNSFIFVVGLLETGDEIEIVRDEMQII